MDDGHGYVPEPASAEEKGAVKDLLLALLDPYADSVALTRTLLPGRDDYEAYFEKSVVSHVRPIYEELWSDRSEAIRPKPGQSEFSALSATVHEIRAWRPIPRDWFPGGYREAAPFLRPGHRVWVFKFVEPGRSLGMAYDGLVFLGGRPVFFPKPWRALP